MDINAILLILDKLGMKDMAADLFNEAVVKSRMRAAKTEIVARMVKEKVTPAILSDNDAEKRTLIRYIQYWAWKAVIPVGIVADAFRDAQDDKIVALLTPEVTATMPNELIVDRVIHETLRLTF